MMTRTLARLNSIAATASCFVLMATAATGHAQQFDAEEFDEYVRQAVDEWEVPGLAVAVIHGDQVLFERGYGVRDLNAQGAVDERTLFAIGSTTKAMTAAAIAMLADDGVLTLDDPVAEHLPWFELHDAYATRDVQVRDLLTHNAGLGNADFLWYEQDRTTEEIVEALRWVEPAYPLRGGFVYQNIMYAAAGEVIEAASGMSWSDFIRTRILDPLEMDGTVTTLEETLAHTNVAQPHYRIEGVVERIENASVDPVAAAGSIWSSVHDMSKWMAFLLAGGTTASGDRLISQDRFNELFEPHSFVGLDFFYPTARLTHPRWRTYGLGWFQADYEGRPVDFHTGSIDGMVAIAGMIRDEQVGVYVLGNRDHAEVRHALMYRVFDLFDDEEPRDWSRELQTLYGDLETAGREAAAAARARRVADTEPSLALNRYVGVYEDHLYGRVEVEMRDGSLHLSYGRLQGPLEHWHFDTFQAAWETRWRGTAPARFEIGASGSIEAVFLGASRFARTADR